jgi:O-acetylserine/cysteine efflux transporter
VKPFHILVIMAVMVIWGLNFVVAKLGVSEMPPMFLVGIRFFLVGALLIPFVPLPRGKWLAIAALSFVLGTVHFGLMFTGISGVDASVASVAIQLQVPFAAIMAAIFFKDVLGWRRLVGMAIAFAGMVLIAGEPKMQTSLISLGLIVAASFVWAISNIQVKFMGKIDALMLTAWSSLMAAPQLIFWSFVLETGQFASLETAGWRGWGAIAYMTLLVSIVGYGIWYHLLQRHQVNQIMPFTLTVPIFGVLSGVLLLGESMTWMIGLGSAMTIAGVGVIILRRPKVAEGPLQT